MNKHRRLPFWPEDPVGRLVKEGDRQKEEGQQTNTKETII